MVLPLKDISGKPIDWWFKYKLPVKVGPDKNSTGFEYLYFDSESNDKLAISKSKLTEDNSALALTLNQIKNNSDFGYVMWNDEIPYGKGDKIPKNLSSKGHSKGILGFSKKKSQGFYLLHSTPRFPLVKNMLFPDDEKKFGQTFLCITLKDYDTINKVAENLLYQNEVQVYAKSLPDVDEKENLYSLGMMKGTKTTDNTAILDIETPNGDQFKLMSKNKDWSKPNKQNKIGKDFWEDFVAPALGCNLNVETWRRGMVFADADKFSKEITEDDVNIDLKEIDLHGYTWAYTKDHAKWGIATENSKHNFIVIADINRQESQGHRSGGGLAFINNKLWQSLNSIEILEKGVVKKVHIDKPN